MAIKTKAQETITRDPSERRFRTHQIWLRVAIILLAIWIARPFLPPIAWAAVLAITEWPLFARTMRRFPKRCGLIAFGFMLATGLFVILPLSLVATSLVAESQAAIAWLQKAQQTGAPEPGWLSGLPLVGGRLSEWWHVHASNAAAAKQLFGSISSGSALSWASAIAGEVATEGGIFLITLIMLAGFLARGADIAGETQRIMKAGFGPFGEDFLSKMTQAVRHTVSGTLLVSVLEGALIGVGYFVAGVPQPLMFTVATILLALVPFGAWLAFGLAGLILIGQGEMLSGVLLIVFGAAVMTVGDNVIQPAVVGGAVELPFLLAFVGAFGGLATMGLVGLFTGPVAMAALLLIWREWSNPTRRQALS